PASTGSCRCAAGRGAACRSGPTRRGCWRECRDIPAPVPSWRSLHGDPRLDPIWELSVPPPDRPPGRGMSREAMSGRTTPPFRGAQVGSLIRPDALLAARAARERGDMDPVELRRIQEAAIRDVVRLQEEIGFRVATDGEFNRGSWQRDFLLKLRNVELIPSR